MLPPIALAQRASQPSQPTITLTTQDYDGDGVSDNIITINRRTPTGLRRIVRVYSGVDSRLIRTVDHVLRPNADLDGNGMIDAADMNLFLTSLASGDTPPAQYDLNSDGAVSIDDIKILLDQLGEPGDGPAAIIVPPCPTCDPSGTGGTKGGNGDTGTGGTGADGPGADGAGTTFGADGLGLDGAGGGTTTGGGGTTNNNDNDPPNCSVTIDNPPKAIGIWQPDETDDDDTNDKVDLPTLTAAGSGNGTYRWEIIQNPQDPVNPTGRLQFVDATPDDTFAANEGPTVYLQGITKSTTLDDVEVKVTFTTTDTPDAPCTETAMINLTVILATLTFNSTGYWTGQDPNPANNDPANGTNNVNAALFANLGAPQLGFVSPGSPPQAVGYFRNMEIRAVIEPCIAGLAGEFDFKRERQGRAGILFANPQGGPEFAPVPFDCPRPNWCDDDTPVIEGDPTSINLDEDLALIPPNDCNLFVIDTPGMATNALTCQQLGLLAEQISGAGSVFVALVNAMDFNEWIEIDGYRASNTLSWHAALELGCLNDTFVMTNNNFGNSLGQGVLPPPEAAGEQGRPDATWATKTIANNNELKNVLFEFEHGSSIAFSRLWDHASQLTTDQSNRRLLIDSLERIAGDVTNMLALEILSPRVGAIHLLGRIGAVESADLLIDLLDFTIHDPFAQNSTFRTRPSEYALVQLGNHAIGPLLLRTESATNNMWAHMSAVLIQIDRQSPAVRQMMREYLDATVGAEAPAPVNAAEQAQRALVKSRLEKFLSTPEPRRPKPKVSLSKPIK